MNRPVDNLLEKSNGATGTVARDSVAMPAAHVPEVGPAFTLQDIRSSLPLLFSDVASFALCWLLLPALATPFLKTQIPCNTVFLVLLLLGPIAMRFQRLYPGLMLYPSEELRRIVSGLVPVLGSLLAGIFIGGSFGLVDVALASVCGLFTVVLAWTGRISLRRALCRTDWWRQPIHLTDDRLRNWIDSVWYLGVRPVPSSDPAWNLLSDRGSDGFERYPRVTCVGHSSPGNFRVFRKFENRLLLPHSWLQKRTIDLLLVALAAPVWVPLMVVLAVAVKLTSSGPAFYGQSRVGYQGKQFRCWKLRSMQQNADKILAAYLEENEEARAEWMRDWKLKNDPRVTSIGAFLRKTSLDELPQLINVIRGEMSLVGPRPIVESEIVELYGSITGDYARVRPGITGLWQINGRNNTSYEARVNFDRTYVRHWSIWLDLSILIRTLKTVLLREGAY